jgi:formylglycine-generating enzyme required for sulfatase activity
MKKKLTTLACMLLAVFVLSAANRTVNLSSFAGGNNYTTVTGALAAAASGDVVYVAAGMYTEAELTIPTGVTVIGGLPATATNATDRVYPGKAGITTAQQTILNGGGGFAVGRTPHRVATVNGTLDGCVVLNGFSDTQGGGVLINAAGTVQNCFIRGNQCHNKTNTGTGGGAYLLGSAMLRNCVLDFNMAQQGFALSGAGTAVNNTIAHNCNAPTWIKITAGVSNKFPFMNLTDDHTYDTWFTNDYYLAQTETTVAQYAVFANATAVPNSDTQKIFSTAEREAKYNWYPASVGADSVGFNTKLFSEFSLGLQYLNNLWVANTGMENRPMPYVSWYGSVAYSQWIGGGLPTEFEWEFAARRTDINDTYCYSNDTYPGTTLEVTTTSPGAQDYFWFGNNLTLPTGNATSAQPVATKLPNYIGLYDMIGNEKEWCSTWSGPIPVYGADPVGNNGSSGLSRVFRGGGWNTPTSILNVTHRSYALPTALANSIGFRPEVQ